MASSPPALTSPAFSMRSLFSKPSASASSTSLVNTVALEDAVKRGDLGALTRAFNELRSKAAKDLPPQPQQRKRGLSTSFLSSPNVTGQNDPQGQVVKFLDSLLLLAVSLGRTSPVALWLSRQPEFTLETRIWAACHTQITHLVDDVIREMNRCCHGDAEDEDVCWTNLWIACATGRTRLLLSTLKTAPVSGNSQALVAMMNQGHPCDGTTPLGIALLFGHHRSITVPHLCPLLFPETSQFPLADLSKTDFKGRNLLHLAVLSPMLASLPSASPDLFEALPHLVSTLLAPQGKKGLDVNSEIPVKGTKKSALGIVLGHLRSLSPAISSETASEWHHVVHGIASKRPTLPGSSVPWIFADCLRVLLGAMATCPPGMVDEVCDNGAWGNAALLQWLLQNAPAPVLPRHFGSAFTKACELGAVDVSLVALEKLLALPSDDSSPTTAHFQSKEEAQIAAHFLGGLKVAVALGHEALLLAVLESLRLCLTPSAPATAAPRSTRGRSNTTTAHSAEQQLRKRSRILSIDWDSPVPDGVPLLHLVINFGLSTVIPKLLALVPSSQLEGAALKLNLNRQSDLRTAEQRNRDEGSCSPVAGKIHRTASLTPCLSVVRTKWLKQPMIYYHALFSASSSTGAEWKRAIPPEVVAGRREILQLLTSEGDDDSGKAVQLRLQGLGNEAVVVHEAARCGNFEAMMILLEGNPSVDTNQVDHLGRSLLYFAVLYHNNEAVRYLMRFRDLTTVNQRAFDGSFPLQIAVESNLSEIVQCLLDSAGRSPSSVDPNLVLVNPVKSPTYRMMDQFSLRSLEEWRRESVTDLAGVPKGHAASHEQRPAGGHWEHGLQETVLHLACTLGHAETVRELVSHKRVNVNARSTKGTTPLCNACISGSVECVQFLLQARDIDLTLGENEANTPIHLAAKNGHSQIVGILLDAIEPSLVGEDILETVIRFCPEVLKARFDRAVWKETLSRSSLEFCYVCDWSYAFMGDRGSQQPAKDASPPVPAPRVAFLLSSMVGYHSDELLQTTLVRTVIDMKWSRYRFFGYLSLLLYLAYIAAFTFLCLAASRHATILGDQSTLVMTIMEIALTALSSWWIVLEVFTSLFVGTEMIANDWVLPAVHQKLVFYLSLGLRKLISFLKKPQNWVKLFALVTSLLFALALLLAPTADQTSGSAAASTAPGPIAVLHPILVTVMVPLALLAAWLNILSILRTTPVFGLRVDLHVQMYFQVVKTLLSSVILFAVLLAGFTLALLLLAGGSSAPSSGIVSSLMTLALSSFGALGSLEDFDYSSPSIELNATIGVLVSFLFLIMVPLVAFNFLVALAVGDVNTLLSQARIESLRTRAMMVSSLDNFFGNSAGLFAFLRKDLPADGRIFPNQTSFISLLLSFLGIIEDSPAFSYELSSSPGNRREVVHSEAAPTGVNFSSQVRKVHHSGSAGGEGKARTLAPSPSRELFEEQTKAIHELKGMVEALVALQKHQE